MSRDITLLHPEVQAIIPKFLAECKKQGLIVKITDTVRTEKEQNDLYAKGRTKAGKIVTWVKYPYSNHNWGMAFDICRNDGKNAYYDGDNWFKKVGEIGKEFGLAWGGEWKGKQKDKPHFELTKYGSTTTLSRKYGTPANFKKTWKEVSKYMFVERDYSYNGKVKSFKVINEQGENFIRVRDLAELLDKDITYNNSNKITKFEDKQNNVEVLIDDMVNKIDAINSNDTNYVKLRQLAELLGYDVLYNEKTRRIQLTPIKRGLNLFRRK